MNIRGGRKMSVMSRQIVEFQHEECVQNFMSEDHFGWLLRNGMCILFWRDRWCLDIPLLQVFPRLFSLAVNSMVTVRDYTAKSNFNHGQWGTFFRRKLRDFEMKQLNELIAIVSSLVICNRVDNKLIWTPSRTCDFFVGSLYKLMSSFSLEDELDLGQIWRVSVPPMVQCFLWFAMLYRLPTMCLQRERGVSIDAALVSYRWCGAGGNSVDHILLQCELAIEVWSAVFGWWGIAFVRPWQVGVFIR
ncbi:hypothetical protein V6N13_090654 [Hibiscus sabdariffa]